MAKRLEELRASALHQELGQKICAAVIAQQQGIALNTAFKKTSQPIADIWLVLAEVAIRGFFETADAQIFAELTEACSDKLM